MSVHEFQPKPRNSSVFASVAAKIAESLVEAQRYFDLGLCDRVDDYLTEVESYVDALSALNAANCIEKGFAASVCRDD